MRETRYSPSTRKSDPANILIFLVLLAVAVWFLFPILAEALLGVFLAGGLVLALGLMALKYGLIVAAFGFGLWMLSVLCFGGRRQ